MTRKKTFEDYNREAKQLYTEWKNSGVAFFEYLLDWKENKSRWYGSEKTGSGYGTFEEVLENFSIKPARLAKFERAVNRHGIDAIKFVGLDGLDELMSIEDNAPSRQNPEVKACDAVVEDAAVFYQRNEKPPSRQSMESMVRRHYIPTPVIRATRPVLDSASMKREISALERKLREKTVIIEELRMENKQLKLENEQLKLENSKSCKSRRSKSVAATA